MDTFPNKPPVNEEAGGFAFKRWFQDIYRFVRGEARVNPSLTAATNLSEDYFYPVNATGGNITVTLPKASVYKFKKYCVKKTDSSSNTVTVGVTGSDTIDGASTAVISTQYENMIFVSDGVSVWHKSGGSGTGAVAFTGAVWLTMVGAGGGGGTSASATSASCGGGSGEMVEGMLIKVTPGASYSYSVGAGGGTDTDGSATTFDVFTCLGGKRGISGTGSGGAGGGPRGGSAVLNNATPATGGLGSAETTHYFGGGAGGGGGRTAAVNGAAGSGSGGRLYGAAGGVVVAAQAGGGGGASTPYGDGGAGGAGGSNGVSAASTNYGAGGGGGGGSAGTQTGGSGAGGYILITYISGADIYTSGSGTWVAPT
jgi:hypothetical protein